jgi:hypothetical protein
MKMASTIVLGMCLSMGAFAQQESIDGIDEAWRGFSDPEIMSSGFTHQFSDLPLSGMLDVGPKFWSGDYWPSKRGGINRRWNTPDQDGFRYKSPSQAAVMSMNEEELASLAPSEKFDLFLGRYDYPLQTEARSYASRMASDWAGICHGWAPASMHHNEPTAKVMLNPDGVAIPFGSADIKALLSYFYAFHYEVDNTYQMGLRCFFGRWMGGARGCNQDLNAGAFHIVAANKLGIQREGFLMDKDRFNEVWNQPVVGFNSKILATNLRPSSKAARNTVREVRIATELFYINESDPVWDTVMGTEHQKVDKMDLQYRVELNAEGKIIGGEWESDDRPDFLWKKVKAQNFDGLFSRLPELLND